LVVTGRPIAISSGDLSMERYGGLLGRIPAKTLETAAAHTGFILGLGRTKF
jgi:hypothetical protein